MYPLYVDLDGTLLATDTLWESLLVLVKHHPAMLFHLPRWLGRGKAGFKQAVAGVVTLEVETLPYREEVLSLLQKRRAHGGRIILATAAHETIAKRVAAHVGCFDDVLATSAAVNLSGESKAAAIQAHAQGAFAYIGNDRVDVPVWRVAQERLVVVPTRSAAEALRIRVGQAFQVTVEYRSERTILLVLRAMRVHQWAKNILLFVPFILAHRIESATLLQALTAFFAFSFTASSIYLLNDLLDLSSDRRHPRKRLRPMASGAISIPVSLILSLSLITLSVTSSWFILSSAFVGILLGYVITTLLYSFFLKRLPVVDVLMLAFFYVYRLVAGAVATSVILTPWLLAFAAFLFVSLGCLKRVSELVLLQATNAEGARPHGRGYLLQDLSLLTMFGINAGFLSTLVLALYINSQEVVTLYHDPRLLWGVVVALLYWIMRLWLLASRGEVHDDPVLFAVRDWVSQGIALFALLCLVLAV